MLQAEISYYHKFLKTTKKLSDRVYNFRELAGHDEMPVGFLGEVQQKKW